MLQKNKCCQGDDDGCPGYCRENSIALDSLLADGLHPNDEGYRVMFSLLKEALSV